MRLKDFNNTILGGTLPNFSNVDTDTVAECAKSATISAREQGHSEAASLAVGNAAE